MRLLTDWIGTCNELGVAAPFYYLQLRRQYGESQRFYHTWEHIDNCFKVLKDNFANDHADLPVVKMALFFHDVVYDPKRKDNEDRSCEQFTRFAVKRGMHHVSISQVVNLIELTKSHKLDGFESRARMIMADVDMSIFAADTGTYFTYAQNVWREYRSYGREAYTAGRKAFLASVDPHRVFYTEEMQRWADKVRINIEAELLTLETKPEALLV